MKSVIEQRGLVPFAPFSNERVYMLPFLKAEGLPQRLGHWQPTVDAMLDGIDTEAPIFLMLDQAPVKQYGTLRRPGVHIDGHWVPNLMAHGGGGHIGDVGGGGHSHGRHSHPDPYVPPPASKRKAKPEPAIKKPKKKADGSWSLDGQGYDEAIILASNITGAIAYVGDYEPNYGPGGEVCYKDIAHMRQIELTAGYAWAGNVNFVHESVPMRESGNRQVVRLNVPGWTPLQ